MEIITLKNNDFYENTYIVLTKNKVIIIDPGVNFEEIKAIIDKQRTTNIKVLLTHGHFDHIISLKSFDNQNIYAHIKEKSLFAKPEMNLSAFFSNPMIIEKINFFKGKIINFDEEIKIYHTPGHTRGSVIYIIKNNIFTGDTLFFDTVGRTDLPSGNQQELSESLKLFSEFDKNSIIYPGHGQHFVLKDSFKCNNFLIKI